MELGVSLHDAVLGRQHRQHFLKVKILTREKATTEREAHKCTHKHGSPTTAKAARGVQNKNSKEKTKIKGGVNTPPPQEMQKEKEDNGRENRRGCEWLTLQQEVPKPHPKVTQTHKSASMLFQR